MPSHLQSLKEEVLRANQSLVRNKLVTHTWGNASAIDRSEQIVVIKPSGVPYDKMGTEDLVCVDLNTGKTIDGEKRPSSDLPTHIHLYQNFPEVGGVVHVHSTFAVAWAQAKMAIPCVGTTHADYFNGDIPVTRSLTPDEVEESYEKHTGTVITDLFKERELCPLEMPGVLVSQHGPFCWGVDVASAAKHASIMETLAKMAHLSFSLNSGMKTLPNYILEKHYSRKHGPDAYYGQIKQ
ncbi:L-ribulose-5-phosphate 4-epimerase AraD [Rhodopirellula sp.]|nr:L-ribulose-5-phosphate 4-epimerase AraD [Rhodopirellula sp.]